MGIKAESPSEKRSPTEGSKTPPNQPAPDHTERGHKPVFHTTTVIDLQGSVLRKQTEVPTVAGPRSTMQLHGW